MFVFVLMMLKQLWQLLLPCQPLPPLSSRGHGLAATVVNVVVEALRKRLDQHNKNRRTVQNELVSTCNRIREQTKEMEEKLNNELKKRFAEESECLQKK